ncbi:MAG: polysaccharide deacetylase [bacterium]|nr:polysaccharide deacetylase [bacterium]MCM1375127.1 polysaccharide deacetylase [Muribaculum sp.]
METGRTSQGDDRRRRVQRLKKMIVLSVLIWMLLPVGLSIILFCRIGVLHRQLEEQREALQQIAERISQQDSSAKPQQPTTGRKESIETVPVAGMEVETVQQEAAHKVYLTFDDGPSKYTKDILDILDAYDVKATFFVLGKENDYSIEMLREIAKRGHTIGMHSYSHRYADIYRSVEDFSEDFYRIYSYILDNTGIQSVYYRFPGGSSNTISDIDMQVFADFLAEQEVEYYDWNLSSGDGGSVLLDVDTLIRNSTEGIMQHGTSIILMHDAASRPTTVEALPQIIENILAMDDTVILPITEETTPVHHIHSNEGS